MCVGGNVVNTAKNATSSKVRLLLLLRGHALPNAASHPWSEGRANRRAQHLRDSKHHPAHCTQSQPTDSPPFLLTMASRPSRDGRLATAPSWSSTDMAATLSLVVPLRRTCQVKGINNGAVGQRRSWSREACYQQRHALNLALACKHRYQPMPLQPPGQASPQRTCCSHLASAEERRPMFCSNA